MKKKNLIQSKAKSVKKASPKEAPHYGWYLFGVLLVTFIAFAPCIQNGFVNLDVMFMVLKRIIF